MVFEKLTRHSKPILWTSFFLGLILSWSVLSGDHVGRVNLLYLIILYVFVPCFSLVYSIISYFYSPFQVSSLSTLIVSFIQNNNFLFTKYKQPYLMFQQSESHKLIFFYFSQLAAMSFSAASLMVLFILLVATDVHFIWRSTLLDAEQILVVLQLIAKPWLFWNDAQPNLMLISNSQDNRLLNELANQSNYLSTNWWQFVLATQLFYAFLMRFVVVVLLRLSFKFRQQKNNSTEIEKAKKINADLLDKEPGQAVKIHLENLSSKDIKQDYAFNNWANIPLVLLEKIESSLTGQRINVLNAGPSASDSERLIADRWRETQLIVVKSWEPPLAELSDFMQNSMGYILPLDIKNETIVKAKEFHLQEWFRFVNKQPQWELLLLPRLQHELSPELLDEAVKNKPHAE